ncbi:hypothetical protein HHL10_06930 [Azohydromonas sp. G-1-1-14]|uniref:Uncharacterized protein n=1 Tax=Azohydromonas caseinilytica TaxID=2728836 RepID=A0A848F6C0_9BURK|nr:hypothetical protein [Azohydromonas caseinilytica]
MRTGRPRAHGRRFGALRNRLRHPPQTSLPKKRW